MKVVTRDETRFVDWKYDNPELDGLLQEKGISKEDAQKMKKGDLLKQLGIGKFPDPVATHCIMRNTDMEVVSDIVVKKHKNDPHSKEKARRYSLQKMLDTLYPGDDNKEARKIFWNAYLTRAEV